MQSLPKFIPSAYKLIADRLGVIFALMWMACPVGAEAQETLPKLTITSPATGLVVKPGQSLEVDVAGSNLPASGLESVDGWDPIGSATDQTPGPNLHFTLTIPSTIQASSYNITASVSSAGGVVFSQPITVTVPQTLMLDNIKINNQHMTFYRLGQQARINLQGTFRGKIVLLKNNWLTFQSTNPAIASVDAYGNVTGNAAGETQIICTYPAIPDIGQPTLTATAEVTVQIPPGSDVAIPKQTISPPQTIQKLFDTSP